MKLVRGSEVGSYLRCRKKWKWAWVDGLKPKRPDGKLFFGTLYHKFVEVYYRTGSYAEGMDAMTEMFNETDTSLMDQVEIDEMWTLATEVAKNYVAMWDDSQWRVLATEITFAIPLTDDIAYTGTIDLIFLDENGNLWGSDHKTTTSIERYREASEMDRQISRYMWALQQLAKGKGYILAEVEGEESRWVPAKDVSWGRMADNPGYTLPQPFGFMYNIISKALPNTPEVLKKGGLSVNKAQKTTYAMYRKALLDNNLAMIQTDENGVDHIITDDKYEEMLQHLLNQEDEYGNKFFRRFRLHRHQEEINAAMVEFAAQAGEAKMLEDSIHDTEGEHPLVYRNVTHDCSWDCPYKQMCIGTMDGSDMSSVVNLFFEKETEGKYPVLEVTK